MAPRVEHRGSDIPASMMVVPMMARWGWRAGMTDRRRNRRVRGWGRSARRRCPRRTACKPSAGGRPPHRPAHKPATWRRTAGRAAAKSTTRRRSARVEAGAAGVSLIQIVSDAVRCMVPGVAPVPISPAAAIKDQRHIRAFDRKRRRSIVVGITGISIIRLRVGSGIPRRRIAVAITDLTGWHDAAAQWQQQCH